MAKFFKDPIGLEYNCIRHYVEPVQSAATGGGLRLAGGRSVGFEERAKVDREAKLWNVGSRTSSSGLESARFAFTLNRSSQIQTCFWQPRETARSVSSQAMAISSKAQQLTPALWAPSAGLRRGQQPTLPRRLTLRLPCVTLFSLAKITRLFGSAGAPRLRSTPQASCSPPRAAQ